MREGHCQESSSEWREVVTIKGMRVEGSWEEQEMKGWEWREAVTMKGMRVEG